MLLVLYGTGWAQTPPAVFSAVRKMAAKEAVRDAAAPVRLAFERAARQAEPLDNARIETLVRRGREKMVIQRALAVAERNGSPLTRIVHGRQIDGALLNRAWRDASRVMRRWDGQSTLGMNAWLMVLASKIGKTLAVDRNILAALERELETAQAQAEEAFRSMYAPMWRHMGVNHFDDMPEYRALLSEAVAQRLSDHFLPLLSSVDRMRFLKLLMQGIFEHPVRPVELNRAVLDKDVKAGLKFMGPRLKRVTCYGKIKEELNECAARAAEEAASNNITSVSMLRQLMRDNMEHLGKYRVLDADMKEDWEQLIRFYKEGGTGPEYPKNFFLR